MKRMMISRIAFYLLVLPLLSCNSKAQDEPESSKVYPVVKTEAQWKSELGALEYYVLRQAGTEGAFSSPLNKNYVPGTYHCRACDIKLYASGDKFDSGTGWPSFDRGVDANLEYGVERVLGHARTEIKCANCGSHLGHLFDDGPQNTTGKRHCINGAALTFKPTDDE